MAEFDDLRGRIGQLNDEQSALRARLVAAGEDVKRGRPRAGVALETLQARELELGSQRAGAWKDFVAVADPKRSLERLDDRQPILLFPLRIETRFKTGAAGQPQLWVRLYPDEALVNSFEPSLTEAEVLNAQRFWMHMWRAGADEAVERAAWRDLAASHGVGRAGWVVKEYRPLNTLDKPVRNAPGDVLLIVPAAPPLSADAVGFWTRVWKAGADAASLQREAAALAQSIGAAAAQAIVDAPPFNLIDPPVAGGDRASTAVQVVAIAFTPLDAMPARRSSWSSAPRIELLPERFVLTAYAGGAVALEHIGGAIATPLAAGPDPHAPATEQLRPDGDMLHIPEPLRWMFDFDAALAAGMAMRIDLSAAQAASGFDRIVVIGVRLASDAARGRADLEHLIENHLHSRRGLSIVSQGTPTNNTEKAGAGARFGDDPEAGFDAFVRGRPLYTVQADPLQRRDGQWLADLLGLSHGLAQRIPNAEGQDQIDARAMHLALWPGTLGYMMRTMMQPVFAHADIDATRQFLSRYAIGRGWIPALRVGDQPYGVLPCTDFSRIGWFDSPRFEAKATSTYLRRLYALLGRMEGDWASLVGRVSFVGMGGRDPHQVLLDVLGLHPASVEYHPLTAHSKTQHFHLLALANYPLALSFLATLDAASADPMQLLRDFGYSGETRPDALDKMFSARQPRLDGPVVDEPPVSETALLTKVATGANYIEWLVKAAETDLDILQEERGFDAEKKPRALLYLLLRHAMQLSYHLVGAKRRSGSEADLAQHLAEPKYVHVAADAARPSESRYAILMRDAPEAGTASKARLADYISRNLRQLDPELTEQVAALEHLAGASTARLERAFAEHIDCCSYRLDAWKQGLLHWQLERLRSVPAVEGQRESGAGVYLGAFGWLEDVRPENRNLTPQALPQEIARLVDLPGDPPLMHDPTNAGLIHAPSLNHATTAAVLRNGWLSHGGRLAVDLSSRRVRLALGILEGMRNGQSLGALLGYHFERTLHDSSAIGVRALVFELRRQFPLVANQIAGTADSSLPIEAVAAMNVVDGVKLLRHVEAATVKTWPYGLPGVPAPNPASLGPVIDAAVATIADINDAVADLVLAEGVHQAVNGNYDRSAATLDAFAKGALPPEPEVAQTPRSGSALVLRTAIHFDPASAAAADEPPLARVEPAVDAWLRARLPDPADVGCNVHFTSRGAGPASPVFVSQADLGLAPIELVYLVDAQQETGLRFLDDRILARLHAVAQPRLDAPIRIAYTERVNNKLSWFELEALLVSLRKLVTASRPLVPADLVRGNDASQEVQDAPVLDAARLTTVREELRAARLPALATLQVALAGGTIDAAIDAFGVEFAQLARYRQPQTGTGFAYEWRSGVYIALAAKLDRLLVDWRTRRDDVAQRLADYDSALPATEAARIAVLRAAEIVVSTGYLDPQPASGPYRIAVGNKHVAFATRLTQLETIATTRHATLEAFVDALEAHDLKPFDTDDKLKLGDDRAEIARFRRQLIDAAATVARELNRREFTPGNDAQLAGAPATATVQQAAQRLFGEDFRMVPSFVLGPKAKAALAAAAAQSDSGDLTRYARETIGREFPVDDWLHGIARVRDKMQHWENATMLCEAFGTTAPALKPLQLPAVAGEAWYALELPPATTPSTRAVAGDRLLYNAHFDVALDPGASLCGLLVDEWTEVIPQAEETTGVAFHFDRPNSEPPQVWLLALASRLNGSWSWDELLGAVNDALESAKRRAVEPDHVLASRYGWLLPATYAAYTFPEISMSNAYLRNVRIYDDIATLAIPKATR